MKATLTADEKDKAVLVLADDGQGLFQQTIIVLGYDQMPEKRAREIAELLGWEIEE